MRAGDIVVPFLHEMFKDLLDRRALNCAEKLGVDSVLSAIWKRGLPS